MKVGSNVLVGEDAELLRLALSDMVAGMWKKSGIPDRWMVDRLNVSYQILLESPLKVSFF